MKDKIINIRHAIAVVLSLAFSYFKNFLEHPFKHSLAINLFKGKMCRVLHMARCTNVATFEILPLHSGVVWGL